VRVFGVKKDGWEIAKDAAEVWEIAAVVENFARGAVVAIERVDCFLTTVFFAFVGEIKAYGGGGRGLLEKDCEVDVLGCKGLIVGVFNIGGKFGVRNFGGKSRESILYNAIRNHQSLYR